MGSIPPIRVLLPAPATPLTPTVCAASGGTGPSLGGQYLLRTAGIVVEPADQAGQPAAFRGREKNHG